MRCTLHYSIHQIAPYINWLYFFHAWGFPAKLASIANIHGCEACRQNWLQGFRLSERAKAYEAIRLFDEAQVLLRQADAEGVRTHAKFALLKANSMADDVMVQLENGTSMHIPFMRQQIPNPDGICLCLSDFIRPEHKGEDRIGCFVCCTDSYFEQREAEDEYRHLLHQTLADRLAEATAEKMHEEVRKQYWGYAPNEQLTIPDLWAEKYTGKRPAVGYPSIPDQSMTFLLDEILEMKELGIQLTESGAMRPHASTCGFMFSHPMIQHFSIGSIGKDQLCEYAKRRNRSYEEMLRFVKIQ